MTGPIVLPSNQPMRLSVRLVLLGVCGPLVSMVIYFIIAAFSSLRLSQQAGHDMARLLNNDNLSRLRSATQLIQASTDAKADALRDDSTRLSARLGNWQLDAQGRLRWQGQLIGSPSGRQALLATLRAGLSAPDEQAALYLRSDHADWTLLAGVTASGQAVAEDPRPRGPLARELESLAAETQAASQAHTLVRDGAEGWDISRLSVLGGESGAPRIVLVVSTPTEAGTNLLKAAASLFPLDGHEIAFLVFNQEHQPSCTYSQPGPQTCEDLLHRLELSGGIPAVHGEGDPYLMERPLQTLPDHGGQEGRTLFISVFPALNWMAVLSVDDRALLQTLHPLRSETRTIVLQLFLASLVLISVSGLIAWRIAEGIRHQLRDLAAAAGAVAVGERQLELHYNGQDALGRLVQAFNQMARAVAAREDSLRQQIRTLEININQQELQGEVCSIVQDPNFSALSDRAKALRQRRRDWSEHHDQGPAAGDGSDGSRG